LTTGRPRVKERFHSLVGKRKKEKEKVAIRGAQRLLQPRDLVVSTIKVVLPGKEMKQCSVKKAHSIRGTYKKKRGNLLIEMKHRRRKK